MNNMKTFQVIINFQMNLILLLVFKKNKNFYPKKLIKIRTNNHKKKEVSNQLYNLRKIWIEIC